MAKITISTNDGIVFEILEDIVIIEVESKYGKARIWNDIEDALKRAINEEKE